MPLNRKNTKFKHSEVKLPLQSQLRYKHEVFCLKRLNLYIHKATFFFFKNWFYKTMVTNTTVVDAWNLILQIFKFNAFFPPQHRDIFPKKILLLIPQLNMLGYRVPFHIFNYFFSSHISTLTWFHAYGFS